jgi:hypothetical protein
LITRDRFDSRSASSVPWPDSAGVILGKGSEGTGHILPDNCPYRTEFGQTQRVSAARLCKLLTNRSRRVYRPWRQYPIGYLW